MRKLLALLLLLGLVGASASGRVELAGRSVLEAAQSLKTGQFVWAPQLAPSGPTLLIVNIDTQRVVLFRNGVAIAASTMSTGRRGYETPTGVFTILEKQVEHYSRTYDNAPMPYMQRLTWKGIALHAGNLPGYPASHGCIRLPHEFARLLYGVTRLGMTVVVTRLPVKPERTRELPLAPGRLSGEALARAPFDWHPERASKGMASVIVSIADQRAIVLRDGKLIGSAPVRVSGGASGSFAYVLRRWDNSGRHWLKLQFDAGSNGSMEIPSGEAARFQAPDGFREAVIPLLRPGSIVVVTPQPLGAGNAGTRVTVIEDDRASQE